MRVIWIYSKSINVVDAKLAVFMNYESFLKQGSILLQHVFDNAENVIRFSAFQQINSLGKIVKSISESVPTESLREILKAAADKALSKESIRQLCFNIFLHDNNVNVGTVQNSSYSCRSMFTVRRLKRQLVDLTLKEAARALGSEICRGILKHIESKIKTNLKQNFSDLKFEISDKLFATITVAVVAVVVSFFFPLLGVIIAVGTLVVTFIWSVDVNSRGWRQKVADEIFNTIYQNKTDIMIKIRPQIELICQRTVKDLETVSKTIADLKPSIGHIEQKSCKYKCF